METPNSSPSNNINSDFDEKINKNLEFHDNYFNTLFGTNISTDHLKIFAIVFLLTTSILMYNYEPSPIVRRLNNTVNMPNQSEAYEVEDNPYGFHPFYQVHRRIQFKNPSTICNGIDGSKTLLLALLSRASNVHIREAIRQTWGGIRAYNDVEVRVVFIVGVDDGMLKQIDIEQKIYHGKFHFISIRILRSHSLSRFD